MVENQERMLLYKMIGLIEFLFVAQRKQGAPTYFCFVVGGKDNDQPGGG